MDILHYSSAETSPYNPYREQTLLKEEARKMHIDYSCARKRYQRYPPQDETCFMGYGKAILKDFLEAQENNNHKAVKIKI